MNPFEKKSGHRYLVIARVGDQSLHRQWSEPASSKNYDLCLSYYGDTPGQYSGECDFYMEGKGEKWPEIHAIIKKYGDRIFQYDAVWFPDGEIKTDAKNLNQMFQLFSKHNLLLAQPALTKNANYQVTAQNIDYDLRYTQFVEGMAPLFSSKALRKCWSAFNKNTSGWGLEFVWPKLLSYPKKKIAILDSTPVKHTVISSKGDLYNDIKASLHSHADFKKDIEALAEYGIVLPLDEITFYGGIKKWKPSLSQFSKHFLQRKKSKKIKNINRKKPKRTALAKKPAVKKIAAKKTKKLGVLYKLAAKPVKTKVSHRKPAMNKSA